MSLRLPNFDYYTALSGIGDNVADAIYKYQAPKLWAEAAQALAGRGSSEPVPLSNLPTSGMSQATSPLPKSSTLTGDFNGAVTRTLGFEGGMNPRDTNGTPSNMGINAAANPDVNVASLTKDQATDIYKKRYWDAINGDQLQAKNPALAHVAFDTAVIACVSACNFDPVMG